MQGNQGTVDVSLTGGHAGVNSGSVALGLTSNGTEIGDGLGTTALADQSVSLKAEGYNYADPVWSQTGGKGSFSGSGDAYTLDFGTLKNGVTATAELQILNQLYADDPSGAYTDLLDGSFTTHVVSGAAFDLSGFGPFSGVAAGNALDQFVSYDRHGGPFGSYEEIITFDPTSYDAVLGDTMLSPITLTVTGTVVPEASTIVMMLAGFTFIGLGGLHRAKNRLEPAFG
jgi:hypothetical protein